MFRIFAAVLCLLNVSLAYAQFKGELVLEPAGCETKGQCTLAKEFGYIDADRVGWEARKGLPTDGASIPPWARPFVGEPFEKAFIKAAVIHDHYCDRRVRPWRQTHRVFYNALLESGVSRSKAGVMYFAVLVGGPKWMKVVKGKPCGLGIDCINDVRTAASVPDGTLSLGEENAIFIARPDDFGSAEFARTMAEEAPELTKRGEALSREDVERAAAVAMAGDLFFSNGDEVGGDLSRDVEFK